MNSSRRQFLQNLSLLAGGLMIAPSGFAYSKKNSLENPEFSAELFGNNFVWGAACAALQVEGAWNTDGRSPSVWDTFSEKRGKIKNNDNAHIACDFYNRFPQDIDLLKLMDFGAFRFSLSWSRILPEGTGKINSKGVDFYNRLIDSCLENGITPWVTLYHWDLPQILEDKGGWTNRDIIGWFEDYSSVAAQKFGDRVKNWMVLNEPLAFTSLGYMFGIHAPGKRGPHNFLPAIHHAALCQSIGAKAVKGILNDAQVGSTFSCSQVDPVDNRQKNIDAANRLDAALNRLFIEPALGMGYPVETIPYLNRLEKYFKPGDDKLIIADFDFIGIQYYYRVVAKSSSIPVLHAYQVKPGKRNAPTNSMGMEVYPEGIYTMLEKFAAYKNVKKIYITESGVCFADIVLPDGSIADIQRTNYFKSTLENVLRAKKNDLPVDGFFVWSLTDNFEWNYGYAPRFGLIYVDYPTQKRIMKDSGKWFREFLQK
jgi:beta-glucosidase